VLDELCAAAGVARPDLLTLTPIDPLCRHFFADGSVLDLFADEPTAPADRPAAAWARSQEEIRRVAGADAAEQFGRFRAHAARIYGAVERPFLRRAIPRNPLMLFITHDLGDVLAFLHLDARRSLWQAVSAFFADERLRMLFARYATYAGADPFLAPATLAVIVHIEMALGVYAVAGGMYRLAEALRELIRRLGGELRCGADVERIELDPREARALAVHVAGERLAADDIIVNCDVAQLYARLLAGTRLAEQEGPRLLALPPSLSAYLDLIVAGDAAALPLRHHNVFFSRDYAREFVELADRPPSDPTVYLCNPDFGQDEQRWFFLTNAPPLPPGDARSWTPAEQAACRARVGDKLARHGMDLGRHQRAALGVTPRDFAALFPHSRGALYGAAASSKVAAFKRPQNRVPGVRNLYCVGGSTHPGAGVPMVMLSARIVAEQVLGRQR
jgi:phytoene desaturase